MKTMQVATLVLVVVAAYAGLVSAAAPTNLAVTAPPTVGVGEDFTVEAMLRTADGRPLAGAPLTLFQVGAVGERSMAQATTDEKGMAYYNHSEFTVAHLSLRVRFAGNAEHAPAAAQTDVEISGIDVPPAVAMAHTPGPLVKTVLFSILGAVWLTYVFAGSCIVRIVRHSSESKGVRALGSSRYS